tara:strand:+ start:276 stop:698 length:423 start_codon:yes stop_codon:yes gene_type:complete
MVFDLKTLSVSELKRVLRDYNQKLQKKKYKMNMKKTEVIEELNKMYSWKETPGKLSFLRKGKQHSYVLNLKGSAKRTAEDKKAKEKRKVAKEKAKVRKAKKLKEESKKAVQVARKAKLTQALKKKKQKKKDSKYRHPATF